MESKQALFIKTKDSDTYETLKNEGFRLVDYTNGIWTFVNNTERSLTFDDNKIIYSNMLYF